MNTFAARRFIASCVVLLATAATAQAQPFGVELHNTMMPASGGMGGVSVAQPQDVISAMNANAASLTGFQGSQYHFGGGWAEATFNLTQTATLNVPGVTPFSAKSQTPGAMIGNMGMSRQFSLFDSDANFGIGLISDAGAGVDFRNVPASNGTSATLLILEMTTSSAVRITEKLSVGSTFNLGNAYFDGPFVGNSANVSAFGVRGSLGVNYDVGPATTIGAYWQTKQHFTFQDAIRLELFGGGFDVMRDVQMDLPSNIAFGIANRSLMNGNLLLAMDVLYKQWDQCDLFEAVYRNQWVFQFGAQYSFRKLRLRAGYVFAENPLKPIPLPTVGGVPLQGAQNAAEYLQATLASINQNRISAGVGVVNALPGVDLDFNVGGMLKESEQLGPFTSVNMESYWIGLGMTYRYGAHQSGYTSPLARDGS